MNVRSMNVRSKIILSFISMILSGVIANLVFTFDKKESFIVALLVFAVLELLFLLLSFENLSKVGNIADLIAHSFEESGNFSDFFNVELVSSLKKANREILSDGIRMGKKEEVILFWFKCLGNFETSAQITTYVHPEFWKTRGYLELILAIQKIKIREDGEIRRVFIWETPEEFDRLQELMKEHKSSGAKVKHLQRDSILKDIPLKRYAKQLGTLDLAILDNRYVLIHYLDGQRDTKSVKLTKDKKILEDSKNFFRLLELAAEEF